MFIPPNELIFMNILPFKQGPPSKDVIDTFIYRIYICSNKNTCTFITMVRIFSLLPSYFLFGMQGSFNSAVKVWFELSCACEGPMSTCSWRLHAHVCDDSIQIRPLQSHGKKIPWEIGLRGLFYF